MEHIDQILNTACLPSSNGVRIPCGSEKDRASLRAMINSRRHHHFKSFEKSANAGLLSKDDRDKRRFMGIEHGMDKLRKLHFRADPDSYDLFVFTTTLSGSPVEWWEKLTPEQAQAEQERIEQRIYEKRSRSQSNRRQNEKKGSYDGTADE